MTDMSRLNASATDIRLNRLPTLQAADALGTAVAQFRVGEARAILEDDPAMLAGVDTALQQQETRIGSLVTQYGTLLAVPDERTAYGRLAASRASYQIGRAHV